MERRECGPGKDPLWRRGSVVPKRACCGEEEEDTPAAAAAGGGGGGGGVAAAAISPSLREQGLLQAGWQVAALQVQWQVSLPAVVLFFRLMISSLVFHTESQFEYSLM